MALVKLCGLTRPEDIDAANAIRPDYIGFVFASKSRRFVPPERAKAFRDRLNPSIISVGVFVDEAPERVAALLEEGVIGMAQLHGHEDGAYIARLRALTDKPIMRAFRVSTPEDALRAEVCPADEILFDSGAGTGVPLDLSLLKGVKRRYFLAGGLTPETVVGAISVLHPYAVDVSSGIETGGLKDAAKMAAFVRAARSL